MFFKSEGKRQQVGWALPTVAAVHGGQCPPYAPCGLHHKRRGVILLVVMVLLSLMALMGLTLVLVTAQGRLSALAASRNSLQHEQDDKELATAVVQVLAGSTDPNSSFGAHGLLEDLYGLPQFFGRIAPVTTGPTVLPIGESLTGFNSLGGGANGQLLQMTIVKANPSGAAGAGPQAQMQYVLPYYSGAFCGQVITMLTGPAAGHSGRVVGYFYDNALGGQFATMQVSSFNGIVPNAGDEFMINGRPFSGTGFGLNLSLFTPGAWTVPNPPTGNVPLLTAVETTPSTTNPPSSMPYAYLPNHAKLALTGYSPPTFTTGTYWDAAGPGGANEPYDAPDYQNMMLAMHYYSPLLLPAGSPVGVITPVPSLHRPELVAWYYSQAIASATPAISMAMPAMRSKVILRPEPTYHVFHDTNGNGVWDAREPWHDINGNGVHDAGDVYLDTTPAFIDLNGDGVWTAGETDYSGNTFNPITGCWYITANGTWALDTNAGLDVDNDQDGVPDSIWVDAGLQVQTEADGTLTKNLVAVLCIDMDGKVNLNAHGTLAQLDPARYGASAVGGPLPPTVTPPTMANPLTGTATLYKDIYERNLPVGQGDGPADVNLLHLLKRVYGANALGYYQVLLQGYNGYTLAGQGPLPSVDGRNGESARLTIPGASGFSFPGVFPPSIYPFGTYPNSAVPLSTTQMLLSGPRPGWSQWYDPYNTSLLLNAGFSAYWVNDPVALARFSDIRPGLLTPPVPPTPPASILPFFFDFLLNNTALHVPTGHGTPSDLHSRGFLTTDLSGRPYYAGTANFPWQTTIANYSATMVDAAVNQYPQYTTLNPPYMLSDELHLNDAVDTQYEMDLSANAAQRGRNTGNSINNVADYATIDAKFLPSELEGILRSHESSASGGANSAGLAQRLNSLETAASYLTSGTVPASTIPTSLGNDKVRLAVTSDGWDLPMPNIALTPRQIQDIVQYVNYYGAATGTQTLNLNNLSLADLARARIFADNFNPAGGANLNYTNMALPSGADLSLFGNLKNIKQFVGTFPFNTAVTPLIYPVWPLLAPETILGMRLDVNRLLGNGTDDNGNGVVDEPGEVLWMDSSGTFHGEALHYPFSQINTNTPAPMGQINAGNGAPGSVGTGMNNLLAMLDLNNDGYYPGNPYSAGAGVLVDPQSNIPLPADPTDADMRARQLLAKQLYCLVMLLLDDRLVNDPFNGGTPTAVMAQIFNSSGAPMPPGNPNYATLAAMPRQQAAYVIAQWAINVVDFRDRDSIMTPFEFDLNPFYMDTFVPANPALQLANVNVTWNVDDIIDPAAGAPLPYSRQDDSQPFRGLVWGCERPELLLTETVAFHDRGTADTTKGENINDQTQAQPTGPDTLYMTPPAGTVPVDKDFDQVRRPRGSLIVELFNPSNYWDAPQFDMQSSGTSYLNGLPQPWQQPDGNGNQGYGVNLAQVAAGQPANGAGPLVSPVWRLAIAYSPTYSESAFYSGAAASPWSTTGSKQLDPRAPVLPFTTAGGISTSTVIHRAVYFAPYQNAFVTGAGANLSNTAYVNDVLLHRSFFADPDVFAGYVVGTGLKPAALMLPPGQYAMVGPANQDPVNNNGNYMIYAGKNNTPGTPSNIYPLSFQLGNQLAYNTISYVYGNVTPWTDANGNQPYSVGYPGNTIKPVIGVPIQTTWFMSTGGNPTYVPHNMAGGVGSNPAIATTLRMSVSEPEHGYPIWPASTGSLKDDYFYYNSVGSPNTTGTPPIPNFPQHPFDSGQVSPQTGNSYSPFNDVPNSYVAPDGAHTQTMTPGYTVLFLQRLANPLQAWDAYMNPYITVDSMPVDLTAYTGEPNAGGSTAQFEPTYPNGIPGTFSSFETRRRGYNPLNGTQTMLTAQNTPNVWTPLPLLQPTNNPYLTSGQFGVTNTADGTTITPMPKHTLGYVNAEYSGGAYYSTGSTIPTNIPNVGASGLPANVYNGDPLQPFPWLAWNNRPYISQFELMLVPGSSPSSQLQDFGMLGWQSGATPLVGANSTGEYQPSTLPVAGMLPVAQFMNLLNFFNNQQTTTGTTLLPNLYRVFEFLQVPSRYTGTNDMLDPSQFSGDNAIQYTGVNGLLPSASHLFHTPFNWLSRYRDPGRVNLNTIFDPVVFQSLMDDYPGTLYPATVGGNAMLFPNLSSLWSGLVQSRQGFVNDASRFVSPYPAPPPNPISQFALGPLGFGKSSDVPTYFANPFRPDGSGAFVPWADYPNTAVTAPLNALKLEQTWSYPFNPTGIGYNGVNTTVLRPPLPPNGLALFDDTNFDTNNPKTTTYKSGSLTAYRNAGQNATFQYQMFTRLGNNVTNRSNVYAIWVTLGKFEVQPVAVTVQNPDGYKLVKPAMDDAGNQVRKRGFYIFDRSIPMGFQRGQDLNTDRGMLVEHVLE
jgi:hypothetical protein